MRTPGFHAMNALADAARPYRFATSGRRETNALQPALAIYVDGRFVCNGEVTGNGYINCYPLGGGGANGAGRRAVRAGPIPNRLPDVHGSVSAPTATITADHAEVCAKLKPTSLQA